MHQSEMYCRCVDELRSFADGIGSSDVVLGLSGGMDSSIVAVMCADAFGRDRVHGVLMPGPYSSDHSVEDAHALAAALGIETCTVPIAGAFSAFEEALAEPCGGALAGIAAENTQARCRMVCLMALSNTYGWMLVNTGNRSEAAMGYSTLYGDTAGAFAPIGGLYKTDVYALARWRNEQALLGAQPVGRGWRADVTDEAPIPERVFLKPPSAELSPDQEDETSLGIDYVTLDRVLLAACEQGRSAAAIARDSGLDLAFVESLLARVDAFAYKRALEPPFPRAAFYA